MLNIIDIALYAGTFVFGLSGALKARASTMDIFGALVLSFVTAYGGGTIRDVLVGVKPIGWIHDDFAIILIFLSTCTTFFFGNNLKKLNSLIYVTDAIGLGLFTIGGIEIALQHDISLLHSVLLGVVSGTFGGLLADIFSNKVPALLVRGELYATAAALGGLLYILLGLIPLHQNIRLPVCVGVIFLIRFVSKKKKIHLPNI